MPNHNLLTNLRRGLSGRERGRLEGRHHGLDRSFGVFDDLIHDGYEQIADSRCERTGHLRVVVPHSGDDTVLV